VSDRRTIPAGKSARETLAAPTVRRRARKPVALPQSSRRARARQTLRWALVFLSLVLATDALFGDKGLLQMVRARRQHAHLSGSIARLREENARLREEARRLKDDPTTVESLARKELGLIRPGEVLFVIKDRTNRH
jgi:cell division protein FtsB